VSDTDETREAVERRADRLALALAQTADMADRLSRNLAGYVSACEARGIAAYARAALDAIAAGRPLHWPYQEAPPAAAREEGEAPAGPPYLTARELAAHLPTFDDPEISAVFATACGRDADEDMPPPRWRPSHDGDPTDADLDAAARDAAPLAPAPGDEYDVRDPGDEAVRAALDRLRAAGPLDPAPAPGEGELSDEDRTLLDRPTDVVDAEIRAAGGDPDEIGRHGEVLARVCLENRRLRRELESAERQLRMALNAAVGVLPAAEGSEDDGI